MATRRRRQVKSLPNDESSDDDEPLIKKINKASNDPPKEKQNEDSSSSESDIETYLQPIDKIDLNLPFFNLQKPENPGELTEKNTSTLSDSDNDEAPPEDLPVEGSGPQLDFKQLQDYTKKIEETKRHVELYNAKKQSEQSQLDIIKMLAAGESKLSEDKQNMLADLEATLHSSDFDSCSDSEKEGWEEVKTQDTKKEKSVLPKEGLQITVEMPGPIKKKKGVDLLTAIKRRFNRVKKENQVLIHKVHLLCWIAHGKYVSSAINSNSVLGLSLSLLPSQQCYPADRTDLNYLEGIVQWYRKTIVNINKPVPKKLPLNDLLQLQITKKEAYNYKMLVFIFIAILRSLGIQCRLVLSFQTEPLRPPSSELCSLSTKDKDTNQPGPSKTTNKPKSVAIATPIKKLAVEADKKVRGKSVSSMAGKASDTTSKSRSKSTSSLKSPNQQVEMQSDKKNTPKKESRLRKTNLGKLKDDVMRDSTAKEEVKTQKGNRKPLKSESSIKSDNPKMAVSKSRSKSTSTTKSTNEVNENNNTEDRSTVENVKPNLRKLKSSEVKQPPTKETALKSGSSIKSDNAQTTASKSRSKSTSALKSTTQVNGNNKTNEKSTGENLKPNLRKLKASEDKKLKTTPTKETVNSNSKLRLKQTGKADEVEKAGPSSALRQETKSRTKSTNNEIGEESDMKKPNFKKLKQDNKTKPTTTNQAKKNNNIIKLNVPEKKENETGVKRKLRSNKNVVPQVDGAYSSEDEFPQLDGANDSDDEKSKPNLKRLKRRQTTVVKYKDTDSEDDFATKSSSDSHSARATNKPNLKKLTPNDTTSKTSDRAGTSLDVRKDVMNLVMNSINQQKVIDRSRKVKKRISTAKGDSEDSDYIPEVIKKKHQESEDEFAPKVKVKQRVQVKKVISSDSDDGGGGKKKKGIDVWAEVFLETEEKWISVDVVKGQVHCVSELHTRATHPVSYIVAWNNDNSLKDITRRYCQNFNTVTRKLRIDAKWWEETLKSFMGSKTARDREEDEELDRMQLEKPLPTSIAEYKNHPLYVLKRHLLKFEGIYPPDAPTLGFVRQEAVYSRQCVYTLHSRDIWLKHAKIVKPGEKPYKIVKARPKWDKLSNTVITDQLLEIFGPWQTEDYVPPTAENGVVPRNAFGNVELFKPCMLPKKTVHLKLPGLNKIARRMNIDCASAIVGFDFHSGWSHPTYDGFVVCEEFEDILVAAWDLEQEEMEKKEQEKLEKRVYGNWKKLIRGLLIRERLKAKYEFGEPSTGAGSQKKKAKGPKFSTKKRKAGSDSESD